MTESFNFSDFQSVNCLLGVPHPIVLGDEVARAKAVLESLPVANISTAVILEDFVGTGKQAGRVLQLVRSVLKKDARVLFVPLIILDDGLTALSRDPALQNVSIRPVMVIPAYKCVRQNPNQRDHEDFAAIRALVKATSSRVMRRLDGLDDPPKDAFGYGKCGALLVTYHNASNNSLPLIHHAAPDWFPLFRRVHHSKKVRQ